MKLWDHIDEIKLREMRASGMRTREIAEAFGVSSMHVEYRCKDLGILSPIGARAGIPFGANGGRVSSQWEDAARDASDLLLKAIRKHHPERVAS